MKHLFTFFAAIMFFLIVSTAAEAHVVVKPNQAGIGAFQTFTVGVPNEKDNPVVGLRLIIPEGLNSVTPNVKPGWNIEVKKTSQGEEAMVTEIIWSKGVIPSGQRDDFNVSAQVPAKPTTIQWKAYQIYQDGTVISWDQKPDAHETDDDSAKTGPYSETKIIDDLSVSKVSDNKTTATQNNNLPLIISIVALVFSFSAMRMNQNKK